MTHNNKQFPLLGTAGKRTIPWIVAERAYATGAWGYSQSLERLAERGGFGESELDAYYPQWREEVSTVAQLRAQFAALTKDYQDFIRRLQVAIEEETLNAYSLHQAERSTESEGYLAGVQALADRLRPIINEESEGRSEDV